ncbi:hypothetical protein VTP01DRAFT_7094 [Rhizomucor pusillus]|uniref:uncharacterized protein n=1 Tax=Rhizomucor pusillus TaxID=4840 RepID=UPI00374402FA
MCVGDYFLALNNPVKLIKLLPILQALSMQRKSATWTAKTANCSISILLAPLVAVKLRAVVLNRKQSGFTVPPGSWFVRKSIQNDNYQAFPETSSSFRQQRQLALEQQTLVR